MSGVRLRPGRTEDAPALRAVLKDVLSEFGLWKDHRPGLDAWLRDFPGPFAGPRGRFLVVEEDGRIVGCGGLRPLDARRAELGRMYLLRGLRGRGTGGRMLEALLAHARRAGFKEVVLESSTRFERAIRMYAKAGFRGTIRDTPDCCNVEMRKKLTP